MNKYDFPALPYGCRWSVLVDRGGKYLTVSIVYWFVVTLHRSQEWAESDHARFKAQVETMARKLYVKFNKELSAEPPAKTWAEEMQAELNGVV